MSTYKKSFRPSASLKPKGPELSSPTDNKRTFDARPKPSDDRRREERVRPGQHIDPVVSDPLDEAGADTPSDD